MSKDETVMRGIFHSSTVRRVISWLSFLLCLCHRGVSVAPFGADKGDAELLQDVIPRGGLRLQHHPDVPERSNWIHALQQRSCKCFTRQLSLTAALPECLREDNFLFFFLLENKFQGTNKVTLKRRNRSYGP